MGILVNQNQIGGGGSNSSHNIGDIFYTTRTDNSLNGAVECNGSQYNFSDFDSNLQSLFDDGKLPYIPIGDFDEMVSNQGGCDSFGYGISNSSVVEIYAWGASYSISPYPETVYTTTDNPVEEDIVYELSNGVITKLGTVAIKQSSTTIRIRFENDTEIAGWNRQTGSDTTAELVQPFSPTTYFKVPKKLSRVLVRTQKPTADNNYTWYNVYADGWVEQGGTVVVVIGNVAPNTYNTKSITFPIAMQATKCWNCQAKHDRFNVGFTNTDGVTTGANVYQVNDSSMTSFNNPFVIWEVKGYATPSEYTKDKWNYQNVQVERPMIQLFNSTTDTAVATCNQVLADVSALNQGDYVIETQFPTAENNYTWYRLYKSGWVEQGGRNKSYLVSFPIEMADTNYLPLATPAIDSPQEHPRIFINELTTTGMVINYYSYPSTNGYWQVSGMSAQRNN